MSSIIDLIKSHTSFALRRSLRQVSEEWKINRVHQSAVKKARQSWQGSSLKINLGSGPFGKAGWLNIDLYDSRADLRLDLREPWPFPDGSVTCIYSEHVFEHFEIYTEVPHVLSESLRVLQPGGVFDVGVPDTECPLRGYGFPDDDYWKHVTSWHPADCETQLDHINYHFRQGSEHKYAWDEETLGKTLLKAGFVDVNRRPFDPALDSEHRQIATLYMRAFKPGPAAA